MSALRKSGVTIDVCPSCGGVWLDGGELATLIRKHRPDLRVRPLPPDDDLLDIKLNLLVALLMIGD